MAYILAQHGFSYDFRIGEWTTVIYIEHLGRYFARHHTCMSINVNRAWVTGLIGVD